VTNKYGGASPGGPGSRFLVLALLIPLCLAYLARGYRSAYADNGLARVDEPTTELPPQVLSHSPGADARQVPLDTAIAVRWSKPMAPGASFFVVGPYGFVDGAYDYDPSSYTITFIPGAELRPSTRYGVLVIGQADAMGQRQRERVEWSFRTVEPRPAQLSEFGQEDGIKDNWLWSAWPWLMLLVAVVFLAGFIRMVRGIRSD
jgi:hypothetical protein